MIRQLAEVKVVVDEEDAKVILQLLIKVGCH
jgi:hypothetical protein